MKVAITGATGMLGQALFAAFESRHVTYPFSSQSLEVTSLDQVRQVLKNLKPDWVIHAAAYTQVDRAESESMEVYRVNVLGTRNVATVAAELGCGLLYYSTDYVFDGRGTRPYREWDQTCPVNEYGRSKLAGEFVVRSLCPFHLILRTSWLFGPGGCSFVTKVLDKIQEKECFKVVDDQRGSPTFTQDLAKMTSQLMEKAVRGTYHITNRGECSWYQFAKKIIAFQGSQRKVHPVSASSLSLPARRPVYSVLDNCVLKLEGMSPLRSWEEALAEFLNGCENDKSTCS